MIRYAVIDTNVLVSALLSPKNDSATVQVVQKIINGNIKHFRKVFCFT